MKKIYLHIGPYKTGSTSLQYFLFNNKDLLNKHGYGIYWDRKPEVYDDGINDVVDLLKEQGWGDWYNKTLPQFIKDTNFDSYIFSEEQLYPTLTFHHPDLCRALEENKTTIILYARRIDNISLSIWKYSIRYHQVINEYEKSFNPTTYHYASIVQGYKARFPKAKIKVRSYEYPYRGDIQRDFLYAIDCHKAGWIYNPVKMNPSLTLNVAYALFYLKKKYKLKRYPSIKSNHLLEVALEHSLANPEPKDTHPMNQRQRQNLIDSMSESTKIIEKYYYDGERLHPPLISPPFWRRQDHKIQALGEELLEKAVQRGFSVS